MSLVVGLIIAGLITWNNTNNIILIFQVLLTVGLLCILEISLSFDNA